MTKITVGKEGGDNAPRRRSGRQKHTVEPWEHGAKSEDTQADAEKNLDNIKQANNNATDFQVMDNYILVVARYDKSYLMGELRSL